MTEKKWVIPNALLIFYIKNGLQNEYYNGCFVTFYRIPTYFENKRYIGLLFYSMVKKIISYYF